MSWPSVREGGSSCSARDHPGFSVTAAMILEALHRIDQVIVQEVADLAPTRRTR